MLTPTLSLLIAALNLMSAASSEDPR